MISAKDYRRHSEPWWIGKAVRLEYDVTTNGGIKYPRGTLATITRKFGGFDIESEPCKCCGVRVQIKQLPCTDLSLVESI